MSISGRSYRYLVTLGLIAGLGLISRLVPIGSILWDKYLGDVVYAAVFYLGLSLIWPRGAILAKAFLTVVYVVAIETFQLTLIPAQLSQSDSLAIRLFAYVVLGSRFSGWDLLAYGIGIAGIGLADRFYLTP
ncbi:MAG: DUF2809 domain-containing protein [Anaerolineae bacterium]|nr:DUF2809 domain-containing protein [Anaerolineae bacterium]